MLFIGVARSYVVAITKAVKSAIANIDRSAFAKAVESTVAIAKADAINFALDLAIDIVVKSNLVLANNEAVTNNFAKAYAFK